MKFKLKRSWLKWFFGIIGSGFLLLLLFWFSVYVGLWGKLPSKENLADIKQAEASILLDANEKLLGKYFIFDRQMVHYEDLPKHLVNALVATEDARFYEHGGVDYTSLFRVLFKSILLQDDSAGGGSTISQQLVKNLYGRPSHGWFTMPVNKIKEMIVAKRIEAVYSKKDILTLYLNTVPFSENTFGIESTSQKFFSTSTRNLSLSQAATLVGSLKASHSYNPRLFPERSQLRRDVVLQQMAVNGYIDETLQKKTNSEPLEINYRIFKHDDGMAAYFREKVRLDVVKILDSIKGPGGKTYDLYKDGLKIQTTLDIDMQRYAENAMQQHLEKLQKQFEDSYGSNAPWLKNEDLVTSRIQELDLYKALKKQKYSEAKIMDSLNTKGQYKLFRWEGDTIVNCTVIDSIKHGLQFLNTGFIALQPQTGAIKAYIGGIDYEYYKYDHVYKAKRQVGSTFKPIVYTAAIENGMDACSYLPVKAMTYTNEKDWKPTNSGTAETDEHLNYSLEYGLSNSVNTIAVKVLEEVGIAKTIAQAEKMGISSELPKVPSLALGTAELSLLELASAYTSYVNNGRASVPFYITKIKDKNGNIIYAPEAKAALPEAFSEETRQIMVEMMKATVNKGTAQRLRSTYGLQNDLAGKTGTTQNNKDGWFVGVSPNLVMATWVGNDEHRIGFKSTGLGQGANSALPMVALFLKQMNGDSKFNAITQAKFENPSEAVIAALDCDPEKRDGFLKRLFTKERDQKEFDEADKKDEDKGFFSFLKKKD
ncbi:penicillin-binding protein [Subsaximicrobium wynnwilliamsii]|uniref:Penicillin-binding protein n=1 Tax=Subsaximicrobium wynnwilliamsii TaxID=291179 RepID=A0A5C6ZC98_9FLAO|nr:transglycosylase domain-containing protein [Subsaximicrobium wynnwilliamsii]TXD81789.1 penicillin-binding protein [Subsaximicrobium wynnwilliamsii]TXD87615.1 penicillin-binding protein [Subsaximicrobium wynnwilliamsii]TXE01288.1 penicillin-binding protein [Subsaximicrobium wynnwilliamsii]